MCSSQVLLLLYPYFLKKLIESKKQNKQDSSTFVLFREILLQAGVNYMYRAIVNAKVGQSCVVLLSFYHRLTNYS